MDRNRYLSYYIRLFLVQFLPNEKGVSENTILAYRDAIKLLLRFCATILKIKIDRLLCDQIDDEIVRKFLDYLEREKKCTQNTRNARLAALKTFFCYLGREVPECLDNSRKISAIPQKKSPHKMVDYLDAAELKAVIDCIDVGGNRNGIRDKAMILLMYNTGARVQEIVNIKIDDIRFDQASQIKLTGKGKKERSIPLWKDTVEAIKNYMAVRKPRKEHERHLFLNDRAECITRFGVNYVIEKYADKAAVLNPAMKQKKVTPHTFRHTTAMHLLQSGNELNMVRLWLGHADLNTTHMYIEIDMEMKKEIISKLQSPRIINEKKKWKEPEVLKWLDGLCAEAELCEV